MGNFITVDRKILRWEWYTDINTKVLFLHCLLKANWEDRKWKGQIIKRGSFVTSIPNLAEELMLTAREVRTALNHLEATGEIDRQTTNRNSVIIIKNYDKYQTSDRQTTSKRQSNDSLTTTTKEIKEGEEEKEGLLFTDVNNRQTEAVRRIVEEWNTLQEYGIKPVTRIDPSSKRYQSLRARVSQYSVDNVLKAIDRIKVSDFLQGKVNDFVITFDWFVKPNNFVKVLEGNYDSKRKNRYDMNDHLASIIYGPEEGGIDF